MDEFIGKHGGVIHGALSCFDRMLFRGSLPIMSGGAMAEFLQVKGVHRWGLKTFLLAQAARLKMHAMEMAAAAGRPYQYLGERTRKEDLARQIAERDRIDEGLVCVFALLEVSRTFSLAWKERTSFVQSTRRKCLQLYYYFVDRELGLIHVKLQTWFPFQMQVYLNGHEWLARRLDRRGVKYLKVDNAFVGLSDVESAQQISDQFPSVDWVRVLGRYARRINPLLKELLRPREYYWVTAPAEYSTDILFRRRANLHDLMPRLLEYSTLYFGAKDVMSFLGRKLVGQFRGEVVTDNRENDLAGQRLPGRRVKHRAKFNWIKRYDKAGTVLRVETVINQPEEFRVRRRLRRNGKWTPVWGPMRKGVAFLFRYPQVAAQSNARYLDALACVDDPTPGHPRARRHHSRRHLPERQEVAALQPSLPRRPHPSSKSCSRASTPCTASPTATSERSSGAPHSPSPTTPTSSPARSPGSCAGCTLTASSPRSLAHAAGVSPSAVAG